MEINYFSPVKTYQFSTFCQPESFLIPSAKTCSVLAKNPLIPILIDYGSYSTKSVHK